jgi:hypothetical protein
MVALGAGLLLAYLTVPAPAHSWYPEDCCSDKDCFRVVKIDQAGAQGRLMMLENNQQVLVPPDQVFRRSQDGSYHLCIVPDDFTSGILCAFEPDLS